MCAHNEWLMHEQRLHNFNRTKWDRSQALIDEVEVATILNLLKVYVLLNACC